MNLAPGVSERHVGYNRRFQKWNADQLVLGRCRLLGDSAHVGEVPGARWHPRGVSRAHSVPWARDLGLQTIARSLAITLRTRIATRLATLPKEPASTELSATRYDIWLSSHPAAARSVGVVENEVQEIGTRHSRHCQNHSTQKFVTRHSWMRLRNPHDEHEVVVSPAASPLPSLLKCSMDLPSKGRNRLVFA